MADLVERRALEVLAAFPEVSAGSGAWREALSKAAPVPERTFQNWRRALVEKGYVEPVPETPDHYRPTATAIELLTGCHGSDPTPAATATPPIGVAVAQEGGRSDEPELVGLKVKR